MENEIQSYAKTVKICGMDESQIREALGSIPDAQEGAVLLFNSSYGEVDIRVSAQADQMDEAKTKVKNIVREMKIRLGSCIFTTKSDVTLEETIVQLLREQGMTLTTVESCTGGMLSARLTDVAGVSEVFKQGFITYSNKAKRKFVGVKKMTLKKYSAVSEQTAWEMARGGAVLSGSDVCVSVTGYAGPDTEGTEEPVGLVYIGCNVRGRISVEEFHFDGGRREVRERAVVSALTLLRKCILENYQI